MRGAMVVLALLAGARVHADTLDEHKAERARALAQVLGLEPQIELILHAQPPTTLDESIAHLNAVEQTVIELSRAALTVDATLARLQHEEFAAKNAYDSLEARHERKVTGWNIGAVIVGNGFSIIGSAMQFGDDRVAKAGDGLIIAGAVFATAFGTYALVKRNRGRLPQSFDTNLLAPFLERRPNARSRYAEWLWRYLDTPLPGARDSIHRELVDKWIREHRVPTGRAAADERRLDVLTAALVAPTRVDADALDDRADMLADVREHIAALSVDLELLWSEVRARR